MRREVGWLLVVVAVVALAGAYLGRQGSSPPEPTPDTTASPPVLPTPTATASPNIPRNAAKMQYQMCARNLEVAMAQLKAEYGPEGVVPIGVSNRLSMKFPCPVAGKPTISATGTGSDQGLSMTNLTLFCRGEHHAAAGAPEHFPEIHSVNGLGRLPEPGSP